MRLYSSFLRARLRLARGIGSLLLALFLHNAVRFLAFPLPFPLTYVAISAVTLAVPLTLPVLMELLAGTMLAWLSHDRSRSCKARAKCSNKSPMNLTRNGKIARLPLAVRQELNRRLDNGEQGKKLVAWLNSLPEVQAIVAAEFGGKPIREQNLSEWKQGGYRDWLAKQEALEIAERLREDATQWNEEGRAPVSDTLAFWLVARYALATRRVAETAGGKAGVCCAKCAAISWSFAKAIIARSDCRSSASGWHWQRKKLNNRRTRSLKSY
jgi:hypothetical protein